MNKEDFIKICQESNSMREASKKIPYTKKKFVQLAKEYGCYKPNQGGKGCKGEPNSSKIPLEDILAGKYPSYNRTHLKDRLISEGLKENKCEKCSISEWMGFPLSIQLHHKNGNSKDHKFENLEMLCPNCHSQTEFFSRRK